eukprot:CAMPEP_0116887374 /NCGR_PEP_ID=MMETSP0463-20121206/21825_1 /TAXON_ID=181622 /ORGANISM="Strombidinopsis sp, Strain SopsisLIS2011" /LENGTH=207 /DNA_ID=CAMNT_0004549933 /DNA_START=47 /DNA_END=668 /DNA_ORIENTATION=-
MDDEIKKTLGRTLLLPPLAVCFAFTLSYTIVFKMQLDDLDALTEQGQICYGYTSGSIVNVNDKWHTLLNWGYIFNLIMTSSTVLVVLGLHLQPYHDYHLRYWLYWGYIFNLIMTSSTVLVVLGLHLQPYHDYHLRSLLNWGYIFNLIMTIIYGIGCIGAAFGILAAALGSLCCHAFASCVQFAFFITMAVWRYNSWGSACADNSAIS